ncbi:MAG: DUF1405 domain-containing protein [Caldilineaceae bacterium]|nr:DUF1405 domain-containing protein [Caldilineaceae bacterium]
MNTWLFLQLRRLQGLAATAPILTLIVVIDMVAYFGGLLYWYGEVMARPGTPIWSWLFIPDCPLFGLLGGLGMLMVTAHWFWTEPARTLAHRYLWGAAVLLIVLWLSTYGVGNTAWQAQRAMLAVCSWSLLVAALCFQRLPAWLLGIIAFGQIKYGIWTITAWLVYWRNTALFFGTPHFSFDSVFMTLTHIGLLAQGIFLLTYFRPTLFAALVSFGWFALSDFMDYGLGFYPALPLQFIPLPIMQWSTIAVTLGLTCLYLWLSRTAGPPWIAQPLSGRFMAAHSAKG